MKPGTVLLVDTNIIIEAFRTRCWNALTNHYTIETVEKCCEEALTGAYHRPGYVTVDPNVMRKKLIVHTVSDMELINLAMALASSDRLDAGERHLFAHTLGRTDGWIMSCADRAAVNVALELGWEPRVVALELLARTAGAKPNLKRHFTERWLSEVRTNYKLEQLK